MRTRRRGRSRRGGGRGRTGRAAADKRVNASNGPDGTSRDGAPSGPLCYPSGDATPQAGAPRLIEWTGERIVPWAPDAQVIYEHYHRYLWAQPLVAGRRVLDLGSGEGFGAALLADTATAVMGVDIDERTVEHSRANYAAPNLEFRVASATDLTRVRRRRRSTPSSRSR